MNQLCGYCGGRGWFFGRTHDQYGYQRHAEPPQVSCEYCGGSGQCEDGEKLLPARPPQRQDTATGLPPWA